MDIKIIFIDIDGTLFNDNHSLTPFNKEVCIKAQQQGIYVVINTGRITTNAIKIAKEIQADKFNGYVVSNNGVHIYSFKENKMIFSNDIPNFLAKKVYNWINSKKYKCQLYTYDGSFVNCVGENASYWADVMEAKYVVLNNESEIVEDIARIIVVVKDINSDEAAKKFMDNFHKKFPTLHIKKYHWKVYEITMSNMSKGFAVDYLCKLLKINSNNAMAFGDSYNDTLLMESVGHPVAMENAVQSIKDRSNYICGHNNENGVGNMIINHILQNK